MQALRYYLDRTKDLRDSWSLLFISFKKGHTSVIRPATLSSWLKQTILLCYKQADHQALDLVQVKARDIQAFAASKALYGGVSVVVLGIGLKNQNRLIGNSEQSIIDYNHFSACFVRKTEYSFLPNIITVVFR